jgi:hypothetical protein
MVGLKSFLQFNENEIISYNENSYFDNNYEIGDEKEKKQQLYSLKLCCFKGEIVQLVERRVFTLFFSNIH